MPDTGCDPSVCPVWARGNFVLAFEDLLIVGISVSLKKLHKSQPACWHMACLANNETFKAPWPVVKHNGTVSRSAPTGRNSIQ